ncbi:MAG: DNA translocase FtsK [Candidatus Omnitrophica bacterium]|nr:DNA translocase FtsK [Candidatus Omnitrophota bacterium]
MPKKAKKNKFVLDEAKKNEIWGVLFLVIAALLLVSLISFDLNDIPFHTSTPNSRVRNFAGIIGAYIGWALLFLIGLSSYSIPIVVLFWALGRFTGAKTQRLYVKLIGTLILILASSALLSMVFYAESSVRFQKGGIIGLALSDILVRYFGKVGSFIIGAALLLLSVILATDFLIFPFAAFAAGFVKRSIFGFKDLISGWRKNKKAVVLRPAAAPVQRIASASAQPRPAVRPEVRVEPERETARIKIERPRPQASVKPAVKKIIPAGDYKLPSLDLLASPPPMEERKIKDDLQMYSRILEETLADFDVEVKVVQVNQGPVITRYELEPAPGVKINRITALADDISLAMKAQSVRIVAPIPGKGTVGVEVPNSSSAVVYLKEILENADFQEAESKLTMALGKDIGGTPIITDLGDMPHLLIAGATGSGKTVCVNSIITSMLFQATPDEVKFLMVDPKMVELAIFNDIPHLLCPVVTEHKKVSAALDWVVGEMESRYKLFAKIGARNIDIYNQKVNGRDKDSGKEGDQEYQKLPYIVVIIDELADLMAIAQREIENAIQRLAQLSRAVGIHIILATQRPSVDVITGVIKANFPARISFKVASKVDSRTVLDMNGADKLLGRGDMLFIEPGAPKPVRAQGSLVSDAEIERVVKFIKGQRGPQYNDDILSEQAKNMTMKRFEKDEIYDEAVRVILETRQASVSILQRRLGLGYTRAARIIDMMEQEGIVGPYQGSKPRDILVEAPAARQKQRVEEKAG